MTTETPTPTETLGATETPVETVPSTETPTETPTLTETPEGENTLIVTISLPDGASIEGVPYNLYAAQASVVFETEPYRSGVVGANNTIEIDDLLPGTYKLVISPEGMGPIEAVIEVGDQPLTRVTITVHEDGSVTVEDVPQVVPTAPTEDEQDGEVTALPSTGTGAFSGSMGVMMMLGIAASALMMAGGLAVRQRRG
ncbi:MAG: prealbumin-like fold domain-containing protein [Thermomicrobiales bacterium]|nr:prealbumin-like fold domain-containing protein [Thermomicrobiales bacterium]MCO5228852.1 prealbumin-like fold domain-containing protein [Thermomicrobiales bacterium]